MKSCRKQGTDKEYLTSDVDACAPWVGATGWKETSLPPKPKDAPVEHFNHFGAGALGRAEHNLVLIRQIVSDKRYAH